MIKDLIKLANKLDAKGLYKEADALDQIIKRAEEDKMEIRPVAKSKNDSDQTAMMPVYRDEHDRSKWYVGPADYVMAGERERWYTGPTPKIQSLDGKLYFTGEVEGVNWHKSSGTSAGRYTG
jgi:hypothetical protein